MQQGVDLSYLEEFVQIKAVSIIVKQVNSQILKEAQFKKSQHRLEYFTVRQRISN